MITQVEIARRVGLDVSSVNKILNKRQGPVFRKETIRKVFKIARDMGYDFGRLKYAHRRRFPRKEMSLGVELYVYHKDGSLYDQGVADRMPDVRRQRNGWRSAIGYLELCSRPAPLSSMSRP